MWMTLVELDVTKERYVSNMKKWIIPLLIVFLSGCTSVSSIQKVNHQESVALLEAGAILLDVRTVEEYNEGHIETAILLPNTEIKERIETLVPNQDQAIIVYCRSGNRSVQAAKQLQQLGYTNIYDLGAISNWKD